MSGKGKCNYITVSKINEKEETHKAIVPEPLLLRSCHIGAYPTGKKIHSQPQTPPAILTHLREEQTPERLLWNSQCRGRLIKLKATKYFSLTPIHHWRHIDRGPLISVQLSAFQLKKKKTQDLHRGEHNFKRQPYGKGVRKMKSWVLKII